MKTYASFVVLEHSITDEAVRVIYLCHFLIIVYVGETRLVVATFSLSSLLVSLSNVELCQLNLKNK